MEDIVTDEWTGHATIIFTFPTVGGDLCTHRVPAGRREEVRKIRKELLGFNAHLTGGENDDLDLIKDLIGRLPEAPLIETNKPGFTRTGKGFIFGETMLGDADEQYYWRPELGSDGLGTIAGTREEWNKVSALLVHSSYASLAALAVLASPVMKYVELRSSRPRAPLLSETATFNFVGKSASGKTLVAAIAASVSGNPENRSKWDFTRRGLEEYLESRNEVGAIFDDTEKHIGEHLNLQKAVAIVTQYVPEGSSKEISEVALKNGLGHKNWQTFALSSSPVPMDELVKLRRTDGEKVRFIDLLIPASTHYH